MVNDIDFKLKMIDQVKHEANREVEIQTSVANINEEIIKNSKGRHAIIKTLEKVEDLALSSKTKAFLINVRQDEMKTLELPIEIMKDISEHLLVEDEVTGRYASQDQGTCDLENGYARRNNTNVKKIMVNFFDVNLNV
ncbi:hypothetical protein Tco_0916880 [Tanacetum coccineum]